ncbi:unnamed protein product [Toxocara canis]|uniref:TDP43_N domain-containing protein n=1 Tax=Toxocara canis TaxID=6265 RepID=A0A183V720_TOXCA|nr:unnamed protein product [Toxocara canis]
MMDVFDIRIANILSDIYIYCYRLLSPSYIHFFLVAIYLFIVVRDSFEMGDNIDNGGMSISCSVTTFRNLHGLFRGIEQNSGAGGQIVQNSEGTALQRFSRSSDADRLAATARRLSLHMLVAQFSASEEDRSPRILRLSIEVFFPRFVASDEGQRRVLRVYVEPIEVELDEDGALLFSALQSAVPGASGLYFNGECKSSVKFDGKRLLPPADGWKDRKYYAALGKDAGQISHSAATQMRQSSSNDP